MAKHSVIYLEKMKNIPGIYVIFNMQTYSLYIGKSNCLTYSKLILWCR